MTESDFHRTVDAVFARIDEVLGDHEALDVDLEGGVLTITCADGTKVIVNRQVPTREIWVAARSGGYHFAAREAAWRDTRSGAELFASLALLLRGQAGVEVDWNGSASSRKPAGTR